MEFEISDEEFEKFQTFLFQEAGIRLSSTKKTLVVARLSRRLKHLGFENFTQYYGHIHAIGGSSEKRTVLDLLTTNETYFFREIRHFQFLEEITANEQTGATPFRVWSAACSTGEEPYSIAMTLNYHFRFRRWEVLASDISHSVLEAAKNGEYPRTALEKIPQHFRRHYKLENPTEKSEIFSIPPLLRSNIRFHHVNLNGAWPMLGEFDVIYLRNVMIYFDVPTKRKLVTRMMERLRPGGHLFIGHSESLHGVTDQMETVKPAIYRMPKPKK